MALRAPFAHQHSKLNEFLFARLGVDESGIVVTVASAIARSGGDPWQEGERIASLSTSAAIQALMPIVAQFSGAADPDDVRTAAARLVQLLPKRALTRSRFTISFQQRSPLAIWLAFLLILASLLFWSMESPPAGIEQSPAGFSPLSGRLRSPQKVRSDSGGVDEETQS